ncbi:hypothetical protein EW146_g9421 [Bondarzewia mesenterica]|uniref:Uncharacterized protein n=1 Tax=Bondarzewia mesenterica TaxID=1095465 RepID=A0A4S4L6R4_9AGAM|nr:hypothetical protein EW146_g9421 [Bondarzewia mesenterica]
MDRERESDLPPWMCTAGHAADSASWDSHSDLSLISKVTRDRNSRTDLTPRLPSFLRFPDRAKVQTFRSPSRTRDEAQGKRFLFPRERRVRRSLVHLPGNQTSRASPLPPHTPPHPTPRTHRLVLPISHPLAKDLLLRGWTTSALDNPKMKPLSLPPFVSLVKLNFENVQGAPCSERTERGVVDRTERVVGPDPAFFPADGDGRTAAQVTPSRKGFRSDVLRTSSRERPDSRLPTLISADPTRLVSAFLRQTSRSDETMAEPTHRSHSCAPLPNTSIRALPTLGARTSHRHARTLQIGPELEGRTHRSTSTSSLIPMGIASAAQEQDRDRIQSEKRNLSPLGTGPSLPWSPHSKDLSVSPSRVSSIAIIGMGSVLAHTLYSKLSPRDHRIVSHRVSFGRRPLQCVTFTHMMDPPPRSVGFGFGFTVHHIILSPSELAKTLSMRTGL